MTPETTVTDSLHAPRRVLATREAAWAKALARRLGRAGVRPNSVSLTGVVFAFSGCAGFVVVPDLVDGARVLTLVLTATAIQLRLLCNLLDGMLAVEEGFRSKSGEIYNDLPDRVADVALLVGAGYSLHGLSYGPALGWLAATMAVFTAYIRLLGGSLGVTQHFIGPMAKQHRMFMLTLVTLIAAVESMLGASPRAMFIGLAAIVAGSVLTIIRRTRRIVAEMEAR
jgi:phosphatidylglycerophosphate synthase